MLYHSCTTHAVALLVMAVAQELPIMSIKVKVFRLMFDVFTAKENGGGGEMRKGDSKDKYGIVHRRIKRESFLLIYNSAHFNVLIRFWKTTKAQVTSIHFTFPKA